MRRREANALRRKAEDAVREAAAPALRRQAVASQRIPGGFAVTIIDEGNAWRLVCPSADVDATCKSIPAALRKIALDWAEKAPPPLRRGIEPKPRRSKAATPPARAATVRKAD